MRTFSKIVFICNICFIISAILRIVELSMRQNGNNNAAIPLPALEGSIVVLGFIAIFVNIFFLIAVLLKKLNRKPIDISKYLLWFNLILLPVEFWYFFFSKFI